MGSTLFYQSEANSKTQQTSIVNMKTRAAYLSFLLHKKDDVLQDLLIDILQANIISLVKKEKEEKYILEICPAWKDKIFRQAILNTKDKESQKSFRYIDKVCEVK